MEHPLNHDARYAGPNIGNARGRDAAGQFANQGTGMRFHGNDAHFGLDLCRGLRSPRLIATSKKRREASQQQSSARTPRVMPHSNPQYFQDVPSNPIGFGRFKQGYRRWIRSDLGTVQRHYRELL